MGAWGTGIYDNDDAADWTSELSERGLAAVESALATANSGDYVEAPDGACALAAADVVARLVSGRGENSPYCEDVVNWVHSNDLRPDASLVAHARRAIGRVRGADSELAELWADAGADFVEWSSTLSDIDERLQSG